MATEIGEATDERSNRDEISTAAQPLTRADGTRPWERLQLTFPTEKSVVELLSFVESMIVELTHEPIYAVIHRQPRGRQVSTYLTTTDGDRFEKQVYTDRHGWSREVVPRVSVRESLVERLQMGSTVHNSGDEAAGCPDLLLECRHLSSAPERVGNT